MTRSRAQLSLMIVIAAVAFSYPLLAQVTANRIVRAAAEPHNWLTYNGGYSSQRYSTLTEINASNVAGLELKWMLQNQVFGAWQSNPLVVDGVMYVTQRPNDILAVDARTGAVYWLYRYTPSDKARVCCGANNRGVAILGDIVFMGTLDAHLVAVDAKTGRQLWNTEVGDVNKAYSITMAPLVVKDKVLVGVGGGEFGIRGFVAAYDAKTGKEAWRFYTIPGPGEPVTTRGTVMTGSTAARRHGSLGRTIRISISRIGASAIPVRIGTRNSGPATTFIPTPSWRSMPTPAN